MANSKLPRAARPVKLHPGVARGTQLTMVSPFMGMAPGTPLGVYSPWHPKDERLGRFAGYDPGTRTVWLNMDEETSETRDWVGPGPNDVKKGRLVQQLNGQLQAVDADSWIICTR